MMPAPAAGSVRSDAELLAAHAAGDRNAFPELYRRHHSRLYRVARLASRCPEDADDAVQEAMLAVHRRAGSFRCDAEVSTWLHRIVVNACADRARAARRSGGLGALARAHPQDIVTPDPGARIEAILLINQALLRVPVAQRAAITCVDLFGHSIAEAARLLGVAEGTVKSRRARGRARLAVLLRSLRDWQR